MTTAQKLTIAAAATGAAIGLAAYLIRWHNNPLAGSPMAKERVGVIQDSVWDAVRNPQMRDLALAITGPGARAVPLGKRTHQVTGANCAPRDGRCEANAVGRWVAANPQASAEFGPDGTTTLTCALVSLNGVTARIRVADQGKAIYTVTGYPKESPTRWAAPSGVQALAGRAAGFSDFPA